MDRLVQDGDSSQYGICAQTAVHLFQKSKQTFDNISLRLSILEIYNETLVDLLVDLPSQNGIISSKNKLNIIETDQGVLVPGLHIMPIDNIDDCLTLLMEAQANRAVAEHQLNHASSRSHIIYTYYITRTSSSSSNATATASSASIRRSSKKLTKQQILLTYKQSNDFLLSPPSSTTTTNTATATGNSATDTTAMNPSFISSIEPIEVHSLSQVHLISSFYKDIIHELADNDLIRIQQAIHTVITKRYMNASSIHYHDKYSKLGKKILQVLSGGDGSQMTMINDGMNSIRKPTEDPINKNSNGAFSPTKPPLVPTNLPTMTQSTITTNTETTTQVTADEGGVAGGGGGGGGGDFQQVNSEYFQDFTQKTIAGKDLYSAYEELKETLKENKKRQKQIITLLNDQKFIIDELTIEINQYLTILQDQEEEGENGDDEDQKKDEKGDDNGAKEELENMILEKKEKLDASKKQYRTVHQELLLCKDQIQETQSLKKRAMNALLVAFNDYMKQLPGSES
eukprot:gene1262-1337_t